MKQMHKMSCFSNKKQSFKIITAMSLKPGGHENVVYKINI